MVATKSSLLEDLTTEEKVKLLAGAETWSTHAVKRLDIPAITMSDGPHGVRGNSFFNGPPGMLLPAATAMGATFDTALLKEVGAMLAQESKEKGAQVLLAPTVCLQRSPLLGRGFEAFGEDPILSGLIASAYINGLQENGIAAAIKHFAAHDQSQMSPEDDVRASQRTLRELHLLPFQLAVKHSQPWAFMTSYHRINGVHAPESKWLLDEVLRQDWGWNGLVMSDWLGVYSTSESINAGLDLEMPGPTRWRGDLLTWALLGKKVSKATLDARVSNLLTLIEKVSPAMNEKIQVLGDTPAKRNLCRKVASESIVLLKNDRNVLPLARSLDRTIALIGPAVHNPSLGGGGSADLKPYYRTTPFQAISDLVGNTHIPFSVGCYTHRYTPLLEQNIRLPGSQQRGYLLEWFDTDPFQNRHVTCVASVTTEEAQMYFGDNLPKEVPSQYFLQVKTVYVASKTCTIQIGLCSIGKAKLLVDEQEVIDLWTSHPPKPEMTPMFGQASAEVTTDLEVKAGKEYSITILMANESVTAGIGAVNAGGLRVGCCEKIDPERALNDAVALAKEVDVPILIAGLGSDYESEACDRSDLDLPPALNDLISAVIEANPNTVIINQSGLPIVMPWIDAAHTVVHAWYGGQETGNAIADVLFGKNPSGRLSVTFPKRLEDTPAFLTFGKADKQLYYGEGVFIGYRYYEKLKNDPLFYFGHGLSYTQFDYSNLAAPERICLQENEHIEVCVDVKNTGLRDGYEVVQLYLSDLESSIQRPLKELKAFTKVWVPSGSSVTAKLYLDKYAFSFWCEDREMWLAQKGIFELIVSRSANPRDEVLRRGLTLEHDLEWSGI
ncbi:hypothetical protein OPT61_g3777 [Boeremia exigua]|uniref:Uncharacterized protein n=1 Tax=Boeremia exigua TaxID=749465 RepID=A0ACC2IGJ6_9PLEO|nr:hypothetical protein OPT61_g3777 [Boeremia exigua]